MTGIDVEIDATGKWPELAPVRAAGKLFHLHGSYGNLKLGGIPGGCASGKASVMIRTDLPNGNVVCVEVPLATLVAAVLTLNESYE